MENELQEVAKRSHWRAFQGQVRHWEAAGNPDESEVPAVVGHVAVHIARERCGVARRHRSVVYGEMRATGLNSHQRRMESVLCVEIAAGVHLASHEGVYRPTCDAAGDLMAEK